MVDCLMLVQEDAHERIAPALVDFLRRNRGRASPPSVLEPMSRFAWPKGCRGTTNR
jgi:hypothetical protein